MDFGFTEEQELLRGAARDFLARACPLTRVRELLDDPRGHDPALLAQLAELGWSGLAIPESHGGAGLGLLELAVLFEELGRALVPSPLFATLLGSLALLRGGSAEQQQRWLPSAARGTSILSVAIPDETDAELRAEPGPGGPRLSGTAGCVPDGHNADVCIVTASGALFAVERGAPGLRSVPLAGLDATRRIAALHFDATPAVPLAGERSAADVWDWLRDRALVVLAAEAIGGCEKVLEDTLAYVRQRVQFGKPIAAQQVVQHQCVGMLEELESARAIARYAAWAVATDDAEAALAAAMAKARTGDAYRRMTADSIQLHGGVGFTWELDCHLFYKRARAADVLLGDANQHRARIASLL